MIKGVEMRESLGKNKSYLKSKKLSIINNSCREVLTSILNIVIIVIDICDIVYCAVLNFLVRRKIYGDIL